MKDKILLIVKLIVRTKHRNIHDAIRELETGTTIKVTSTPNVEVLECELLKTHSKDN